MAGATDGVFSVPPCPDALPARGAVAPRRGVSRDKSPLCPGFRKPCRFIFDQIACQSQTARADVVLNDIDHDVMAAGRDAELVVHARLDQRLEVGDGLGQVQPAVLGERFDKRLAPRSVAALSHSVTSFT